MTVPRQWSHGDRPTHTELNKYGTALTEAHATLGDVALNPLYVKRSEAEFTVRHTYRYLRFTSTGQIVDPTGANDPTGLSESEGADYGAFDLDTLGWLAYGALYFVTGVSACAEDWEP